MTPRKHEGDEGGSPGKRQRSGTAAFDFNNIAVSPKPKSAAQQPPNREPLSGVSYLAATPHDPSRGDRHFCAGNSHRAFGDAFQTTHWDSSFLISLLHKLTDAKDMLEDWVTDNGLQTGDQVLFAEAKGTFAPAVVIGPAVVTDAQSKSKYLIRRAHDSKCFEASTDRLSLVGRD